MANSKLHGEISASYNEAMKHSKTAKRVPAFVAKKIAQQQLRAQGQDNLAKSLSSKDLRKMRKIALDPKNKDKLIDASIAMQKQNSKPAQDLLNEHGLSHLSSGTDFLLSQINPQYQQQMMSQIAANPNSAEASAAAAKLGIDPNFTKQLAQNPKLAQQISQNPALASQMMKGNIQTKQELGGSEFEGTLRGQVKHEQRQNKLDDYTKVLSPWLTTRLDIIENIYFKEPCFSGSDEIQENEMKEQFMGDSFKDTFYRAYYSISELPMFGWSRFSNLTKKDTFYIPPTIAKFFFCFFVKICGFPLYIAYLAARFIWMMLRALLLKIPLLLVCIANIGIYVASIFFRFRLPSNNELIPYSYPKIRTGPNGDLVKTYEEMQPAFTSLLAALFGLSIPYQVLDIDLGQQYGRGEIGVFIFIVMAASAILITLTGINVVVIMLAFFYFMFKTFLGIKDKALGKDLRKGGQST